MIKKRTVLVLGAGASFDYGFPLGRDLLLEIAKVLKLEHHPLIKIMRELGNARSALNAFADALSSSMQPSIDALLEKRDEFREVGKAAIAGALIPRESENQLRRKHDDKMRWYEYLFGYLNAGKNNFEKNALSVVTFNYDRSLEHFLMMAIRDSYGLDDAGAFEMLKKIPIVHVYGSLGDYSVKAGEGRIYSPELGTDEVRKAASSLKIMSERQDDSEEFRAAHKLFEQAEKIAIIGFGYQEDNVRRLAIKEHSRSGASGTAYHLGDNEMTIAKARVGPPGWLDLATADKDALKFLKDMSVLD